MTGDCVFCRIAEGATAAEVVWDEDCCLAFLDHSPLFPGHVLLIPKRHYDTLLDLPSELTGPYFEVAKDLARAVETGLKADGTFVAINNRVSQSVPHLHVHIIPRRRKDGMKGFFWPRRSYAGDAHMKEVAAVIRGAMADLRPR